MKFTKIASVILTLFLVSCAQRSVTRISPDQQTDLSGRWNDTDSKMVSKEMISDVLSRPWRGDYQTKYSKKPTVIVGVITNKSHEHIESDIFIKDLEKEFINSSAVRVVDNGVFREKLREERASQGEFASDETQAKWGRELGADYMLFGTMNSIVDTYNNKKAVFYKINLWLTNLETTEKVWLGDKEIKKYIKN